MRFDLLSKIYDDPRPWHGVFGFGLIAGGMWVGHNLPLATLRINETASTVLLWVGGWLWSVNGILMSYHKKIEADSLVILDRHQEEHNEVAKELAKSWTRPGKEPLPKINVFQQGSQVYANTVAPVKIDRERELARTLVTMRDSGFPMNISETYWIREGRWKDGPESFRATRGKWEFYNIVGKRGNASNSRYEIQNERGVELIADGKLKLPPPPS